MNSVKSRREENAEATRRALLRSARKLFTSKGFRGTSLEDVCRPVRVTKGALYHHFSNKEELFLAVFEELELELMHAVIEAASRVSDEDLWTRIGAAVDAFFTESVKPAYLRIVLRDGHEIISYEKQREIDSREAVTFIRGMVDALVAEGQIERLPAEAFAHMFIGALSYGAEHVSQAEDIDAALAEAREVAMRLLHGLSAP